MVGQLQISRRHQGKPPVMTWRRMKQLLQGRFFPLDYQQIFYNQFEHCQQDARAVIAYSEEFYRLASRCDLAMTEEQQASKYISGLKYPIQERVVLHDDKTLKIERSHNRAPPFRYLMPIEELTNGTGVRPSFTMVDRPQARPSTNTPASTPATTTSQLQRTRRIPTPSLRLASVIGVESLNIGPMNALRGSKATS